MKNYRKKKIGERIRESRLKRFRKSVNISDMAKMMGKPYRTYQNWELGVVSPRHDDIIRLANILKVDPGWLEFGDKPELPDSTKAMIQWFFPKEDRR